MKNARQIAYDALYKVEKEGAYSNIVLDQILKGNACSIKEKKLASALLYGVLERKLTLHYCIRHFSKTPFSKISKDVRIVLCIGLYQHFYMDGIQEHAIVNETVNLCHYTKNIRAKSFVNGLLRNALRNGKNIPLPEKSDDKWYYYSIKYACPEWLLKKWAEEYGIEKAVSIAKFQVEKAPLFIKANTTKITTEDLLLDLKKEGVDATVFNQVILMQNVSSITDLKVYRKGYFHVQDMASQLCARVAAYYAKEDTIFDMCSAPGSKSFSIAEFRENKGKIFAFDIHEHRVRLINNAISRLGLTSIHASQNDACVFNPRIGKAKVVLVDAPCSGFGIIRRKPEIKYKEQKDLLDLPALQLGILSTSAQYTVKNGVLLYSTCTYSMNENEQVVQLFLEKHEDYIPKKLPDFLLQLGIDQHASSQITFFPNKYNTDGFFIAAFEKVG